MMTTTMMIMMKMMMMTDNSDDGDEAASDNADGEIGEYYPPSDTASGPKQHAEGLAQVRRFRICAGLLSGEGCAAVMI